MGPRSNTLKINPRVQLHIVNPLASRSPRRARSPRLASHSQTLVAAFSFLFIIFFFFKLSSPSIAHADLRCIAHVVLCHHRLLLPHIGRPLPVIHAVVTSEHCRHRRSNPLEEQTVSFHVTCSLSPISILNGSYSYYSPLNVHIVTKVQCVNQQSLNMVSFSG